MNRIELSTFEEKIKINLPLFVKQITNEGGYSDSYYDYEWWILFENFVKDRECGALP